jgi:hemoglobin
MALPDAPRLRSSSTLSSLGVLRLASPLFGLGLSLLAGGCATTAASSKPAAAPVASAKPLYERLGGKEAITAVVDEFIARVAADNAINARFVNADIPHLKLMLVEQICAASGGPCQYTGKDMKTTHTGMQVTGDEFGAMVGDLKGALDKFHVGEVEQKDLLGALGGMKGDIVGQ